MLSIWKQILLRIPNLISNLVKRFLSAINGKLLSICGFIDFGKKPTLFTGYKYLSILFLILNKRKFI